MQKIKETTKKVERKQLTARRRPGRKLPRRSWLRRRAKAKVLESTEASRCSNIRVIAKIMVLCII